MMKYRFLAGVLDGVTTADVLLSLDFDSVPPIAE
jgi:hypothetical protein